MPHMIFSLLALLAAGPVAAQQVLPQFALDRTGNCRRITVYDPRKAGTDKQVSIGCLGVTGGFVPEIPTAIDISANPDASISQHIAFGNTAAKTLTISRRTGAVPSVLGTTAIVRNTAGSGTFGPAAADYALLLSTTKDDWRTSLYEGEIDPLYVVARQGKKGDVAGILIDLQKRRDALISMKSDETGAPMGIEMSTSLVDATGRIYHRLHAIPAFAESAGGLSGGRGFGNWVHAEVGDWYAAYAAEGTNAAGTFQNYFVGAVSSNPNSINFAIDGAGNLRQGFFDKFIRTGFSRNDDIWSVADETGHRALVVGRTSKVVTAQSGFQISDGTVLRYMRMTGHIDKVGMMAAMQIVALPQKTVAGAQVGDMVTASITSPDIGFAGYRVTGVVVRPNTVEPRIQNLSGSAGGRFTVDYTIKVER